MKPFVLSLFGTAMAASVPNAIFHGLGDACKHKGMEGFTADIASGT